MLDTMATTPPASSSRLDGDGRRAGERRRLTTSTLVGEFGEQQPTTSRLAGWRCGSCVGAARPPSPRPSRRRTHSSSLHGKFLLHCTVRLFAASAIFFKSNRIAVIKEDACYDRVRSLVDQLRPWLRFSVRKPVGSISLCFC
ncbi:uncharacterized protein [Triticum aestivum]|uniref:uncharacterized protein n=1 Tax=Triticum aestivum TaxID=4565 RepID=UPI001D01B4F1|nr:uncharacterized protein LOC123040088 [Triticum aestivum]